MKLRKELNEVVQNYRTEVQEVEALMAAIERFIHAKGGRPKVQSDLTDEELEDISEFLEDFMNAPDGTKKGHHFSSRVTEMSDRSRSAMMAGLMSAKESATIAEMALAYIVSYQEAFTKDYVYTIFKHRREMLKGTSSITHERVLRHRSMKSLVEDIARDRADVLGYGSIDEVAEFFDNKLNMDLREFEGWQSLREVSYRRNVLVHNRGYVNEIYRKKVPYKGKKRQLNTNRSYVVLAIQIILDYFDFVHQRTCTKFKLIQG